MNYLLNKTREYINMGRTKRKRSKKQNIKNIHELHDAFSLQKNMNLKCPNLKISYFNDTGRGIKCKRKINYNDVLISLPLNKLITIKTKCDLFSVIDIDKIDAHLVLSLWLMYEKHLSTESSHLNYLKSLPKTYTNLYFCSEKEKKLFPYFMRKELDEQNFKIKLGFEKIVGLAENKTCNHCDVLLLNLFNLQNFEWAWFTVNTRSVYYHDEDNVQSLALAPFLDMFNHSNDANTKIFINFQNNLYILQTLVKFKKHDQVFIKYGPHSNLKLLIEYGFVTLDNPHDFVEFTFQEVVDCVKAFNFNLGEIKKLKYNFIKGNNLNKNLTKSKEEFSWNLNGLLYVLVTKDQDLSVLQSKTYSNTFSETEHKQIKKIKNNLIEKKLEEMKLYLVQAESLEDSSLPFSLAKTLITVYINILKSSF